MRVLGIESSCDETALAIIEDGHVLAEELSSQADVHALFGGVVPEIASREHYRLLGPLFDRLLARTGLIPTDIDVVAVARGPGLLGSLLTGLGFAKGVALGCGARLVGVNHLHAHLLAPGLERELVFPALGVLVSGGHTHLYLMRSPTEFDLLGRTLDDAAGEAFDKVAKTLNFPYPGGKYIDLLGQRGRVDPTRFPRPYLDNQNLDFSFSGLKTAVAVYVDAHPELRRPVMADPEELLAEGEADAFLCDVCASFNHAVADTLRVKARRALERDPEVRALVVAGGVAANSFVRASMAALARDAGLELFLPPLFLCTDNASMIAHAGGALARAGLFHGPDLEAVPRGRPVPWDFVSEA